jgi:hypothetical protein
MKLHVERMAVTALIVAVIIVLGMLMIQERTLYKGRLLNYQLQAIRTSINLFKAVEHHNPKDLEELAKLQFRFPGETQDRFFLELSVDGNVERFLDPFGNPYVYDPDTGWVKSSTSKYSLW